MTASLGLGGFLRADEPSWDAAVTYYDHGEFEQAESAFRAWIASRRARHLGVSAEAYANLAKASWIDHHPQSAVENLLLASWKRASPLGVWEDYALIAEWQRELGVLDTVSGSLSFFFSQTMRLPGVRWWAVQLAAIALIVAIAVPIVMVRRSAVLLLSVLLLGAFGFLVGKGNRYALVLSESDVKFYKEQSASSDPVMSLAPGVLVHLGAEKEGWTEVIAPAVGWTETKHIKTLASIFDEL